MAARRILNVDAELAREVLSRGGHFRLIATGASMLPALHPGDELTFGPPRDSEPRLGQVVLWAEQGKLVAHRVVEVRGDGLVTSGDASAAPDAPISRPALLGVLRKRSRPLKIWLGLAFQPARRLFSRA